MNRLCIFMGMLIFGSLGWWIGRKLGGFFTAYFSSTIGTIIGVCIGWRINRDFLS